MEIEKTVTHKKQINFLMQMIIACLAFLIFETVSALPTNQYILGYGNFPKLLRFIVNNINYLFAFCFGIYFYIKTKKSLLILSIAFILKFTYSFLSMCIFSKSQGYKVTLVDCLFYSIKNATIFSLIVLISIFLIIAFQRKQLLFYSLLACVSYPFYVFFGNYIIYAIEKNKWLDSYIIKNLIIFYTLVLITVIPYLLIYFTDKKYNYLNKKIPLIFSVLLSVILCSTIYYSDFWLGGHSDWPFMSLIVSLFLVLPFSVLLGICSQLYMKLNFVAVAFINLIVFEIFSIMLNMNNTRPMIAFGAIIFISTLIGSTITFLIKKRKVVVKQDMIHE